MAYIQQVRDDDAGGPLKRIFEACLERAGRVFGIIRVQSQNPPVLQTSLRLYQSIMFGESPLSRAQREMLATVVSRANDRFY